MQRFTPTHGPWVLYGPQQNEPTSTVFNFVFFSDTVVCSCKHSGRVGAVQDRVIPYVRELCLTMLICGAVKNVANIHTETESVNVVWATSCRTDANCV